MTDRITWDEYFINVADLASVRSPCERLKVGCVLVKNNRLISMGYNGFLGGCEHNSIVRDGHEQATIHAEINAITDAAKRGGVRDTLSVSELLQGSSE
jgi:dCMP deaminase